MGHPPIGSRPLSACVTTGLLIPAQRAKVLKLLQTRARCRAEHQLGAGLQKQADPNVMGNTRIPSCSN